MIEPKISIVCNAYNHEKYIAQALDSFLMQRVSVPFEVLVHDDASTDRTAEIIRTYEEKYPDIIFPIYQTVNQYSQGVRITYMHQIPRARGEYIAFCEGDDFWTDPEKLEIQLTYMQTHQECSACCHAFDTVMKTGELIEHRNDFPTDTDIALPLFLGNQLAVPQLATFFVRKEILNFDGVFLGRQCNDMILRIYCATKGTVHYINRIMSAYRRFVEGSWTMRIGQDRKQMSENLKSTIPFLEKLNDHTGYQYQHAIEEAIDTRLFQSDWFSNRFREARKRNAYAHAPLQKKAYILAGCAAPRLTQWLLRLRDRQVNRRRSG